MLVAQRSNTCRIVVGRLVELDLSAGLRTDLDLDATVAAARATLAQAPFGAPLVLVADWRACQVLPPALAERVAAMMSQSIPRVECHATLHAWTQPTAVLQLQRIVQEAENQRRRFFTEVTELQRWLDEALEPAERLRLRAFLAQRSG